MLMARGVIWLGLTAWMVLEASAIDTDRYGGSIAERMCKCFPKTAAITDHILGGIKAKINDFPHMAALRYRANGMDNQFRCGASLISDRFLLTAAHCVKSENPISARLGVVDLLDNNSIDHPIDVGIRKVIVHPDYIREPKKNDIALLQLNRTITEEFLQPACLFTNLTDPDSNTLLTIAGWGSTDPNDINTSSILLKGSVTTIARDTCNNSLGRKKYGFRSLNELQETQLCALGRNIQNETINDTCEGDSGGPLELVDDQRHHIVGVTATGMLCGTPYPGIYMRVSRFLDWIEPIVWPQQVGGMIPNC